MIPDVKKMRFALMLCGAMALAACANSGADMKTAKQARRAGDTETARAHLEPMAAFGLPDAQIELATILLRQDKPSQDDLARAKMLLEEASSKGDPKAYLYLGRIYAQGLGVRRDDAQAENAYRSAMDLGYMPAAQELGRLYEKKKKYNDAEGLYRQACDGQYYKAAKSIAALYEKGKGRKKDTVQALSWYLAAQSHGVKGLEDKIAKLEKTLGPDKAAEAYDLSKGY